MLTVELGFSSKAREKVLLVWPYWHTGLHQQRRVCCLCRVDRRCCSLQDQQGDSWIATVQEAFTQFIRFLKKVP
jgi:hypothetical protein